MSMTLQTRNLFPDDDFEQKIEAPDPLRFEHGWKSVASGLASILIAHIVWFFGMVLALGLFIYAFFRAKDWDPMSKSGFSPDMIIFLGVMVVLLVSLYSFFKILSGKWRCAINAPERGGAKWLVFGSMLLICLGPAITLVTSFTSGPSRELRIDENGVAYFELTSLAAMMKLIGAILGFLGSLLFILFLRAIAVCFQNNSLKVMAESYLIAAGVYIALSFQIATSLETEDITSPLVLILPLVSLGLGVWYVTMIFLARKTILNGFANLRSPFE